MVMSHAVTKPPGAPISAVGYAEPSLVFMLGTKTKLVDADTAAAQITSARGAVALVDARDDAAFRQALQKRGWTPRVLGRVSGLDYSNGRTMVLTLYAGVPA